MNSEMMLVVESLAVERDLPMEIVFEAMELAHASAVCRHYRSLSGNQHAIEDFDIQVAIDRKTGAFETFRTWTVVDEECFESDQKHISLEVAQTMESPMAMGETCREQIPNIEFNRISALAAKQVLGQKLREAERERVAERYLDKIGTLFSGVVKRVTSGEIFVDMEGVEARLPRENLVRGDIYKVNDRVRALLEAVDEGARGPQLRLTRRGKNFLVELFRAEVPEVSDGIIVIKAVGREDGRKSKVAVRSFDRRVDPVGTCIGVRGVRVQAVSSELGKEEHVDIVDWDEDPSGLAVSALSLPENRATVRMNVEERSMQILVDQEPGEKLIENAIGSGGQNVRVAAQLVGWDINVMTREDAEQQRIEETSGIIGMFCQALDVDTEVAEVLVAEGFLTLHELASDDLAEVATIEGFDEDIAGALIQRAKMALLTQAMSSSASLGSAEPEENLLAMEGMERTTAFVLASKGVRSVAELAEQSVDDLMDIEGLDLDEDSLGEFIMHARQLAWLDPVEEVTDGQ